MLLKQHRKTTKSRDKYRSLSEEEKEKKQQCRHKRCKNLSEAGRQILVRYRKKYYKIWKYKNA